MRLIVQSNNAVVAELYCDDEAIFIGSREGCRLHLPDARIAAQHAVIFPEGVDTWAIQPLTSEHDISINGATVGEKMPLKSGDEIVIHDYVIRAFRDHDPTAVQRAAAPRSTVANMTRFVQYQLPPGAVVKRPEDPLVITPAHLARLGRDNNSLSDCSAIPELMDHLLKVLFDAFGAKTAWVGVRRVNYGAMEYVEGRAVTGQSTELPETGEKLKPRVLDRGQFVLLPVIGPGEPGSIITGPLAGPDGTLGMVYMDTGDSGRRYDTHDLDHFIVTIDLCAARLDAIFKQNAKQKAATIEGEVAVAHAIQARLTPRKLPQWEPLQWGAFREPGRERTGDIYDLVKLSNQTAGLFVAHTRAGGAMPSMLMAQSQAVFRSCAMHLDGPQIFMKMMNHLLYDGTRDHPLDSFMGVIDPNSGEMKFALAGWMGAYIISGRGEERRLGPPTPAPSLGLDKAAAYTAYSEEIESGETLVLFTPGVTTARNRNDEVFGEDRFVNILCDGFGQLASTMLKDLLNDLKNFTEGGKQPDDITVLLAHRV